ncbi:MAG: hypothetical protein MHMPM18_003130, partial [Marteilia pararefringens]
LDHLEFKNLPALAQHYRIFQNRTIKMNEYDVPKWKLIVKPKKIFCDSKLLHLTRIDAKLSFLIKHVLLPSF